MDYPLAEALLGFCAGSHLDRAMAATQADYAHYVRPIERRGFAAELERLLGTLRPGRHRRAAEPAGQPRHARGSSPSAAATATSLRLATLIQMTLPGAPCIYYGDEVGMEGGADPANRGAFPTDRSAWDSDLRSFIGGAIALRRGSPTVRDRGSFRTVAAAGGCHVYLRGDSDQLVLVAVNAGDEGVALDVVVPELGDRRLESIRWPGWPDAWDGTIAATATGGARLTLPARAGLVARARS